MTNKEAINWLARIRDRLMTTSSKQFEAMTIAIVALEKQEQSCDTCRRGQFGNEACVNCRVRFPGHYEAEEES